jgi:hypothetical protein
MKNPATRTTITTTTMITPTGPAEELLPVADGARIASEPGTITFQYRHNRPRFKGCPSPGEVGHCGRLGVVEETPEIADALLAIARGERPIENLDSLGLDFSGTREGGFCTRTAV